MILGENVGSVYSNGREIQRVYSYGKLVWKKKEYSELPFTVKATRDGVTVSLRNLNSAVIKYSINGGKWNQVVGNISINGVTIAELNKDDVVSIKTTDTVNCFIRGNTADVYGNIMSLIYGDNFIGQTAWLKGYSSYTDTSVAGFFGGSANGSSVGSSIVNAENLILPATSLLTGCYASMFANCVNLKTAPQLPATVLAAGCYAYMFANCKALITHPVLPATTLAYRCYYNMFYQSGVLTAPELPATTLATNCYEEMYRGSKLNIAPQLPATTLAKQCYDGMFHACLNLFTAPELPASTLVEGCYVDMFRNCYRLRYVKCYATKSSVSIGKCVDKWLDNAGDPYVGDHEGEYGTLVCYRNVGLENYIPDTWTVEYLN